MARFVYDNIRRVQRVLSLTIANNMENMKEYWNKRYNNEGKIWGDLPSKTAQYALELFSKNKVKRILIPGSGYGRNSKLFSASGFKRVYTFSIFSFIFVS